MRKLKSFIKRIIRSALTKRYAAKPGLSLWEKFELAIIHRFYSRYHPIELEGSSASKRNVVDRCNLIRPEMTGNRCLDIGCQAGFFTFSLSSERMWVTGADRDKIILRKAELLKKKFQARYVDFKPFEINEENLEAMPHFDNILYLSIHHHMIKVYGFADATKILKVIASKSTRLFFDFPYYNDIKDIEVFSEIPDMGSDPDAWISQYLIDSGYKTTKLLGVLQHPEKTHEKRPLFMAER